MTCIVNTHTNTHTVNACREGGCHVGPPPYGRRRAIEDGPARSRGPERAVCVCVTYTAYIHICMYVCTYEYIYMAHLHHPPADEGDILLLEVERNAPQRDAIYASKHPHGHTHVSAHTCTRPRLYKGCLLVLIIFRTLRMYWRTFLRILLLM